MKTHPPYQKYLTKAMRRLHKRARRRAAWPAFKVRAREWLFNAAVALVLVAVGLLTWRALYPPVRITAAPETVAAFRIPSQAMGQLYALSQWHDIHFAQLLALYSAENDFFYDEQRPATIGLDALEAQYVASFARLQRRYHARDFRAYAEMFRSLLHELRYFPVPAAYDFMYSDTWGRHRGTDIIDRENVPGRIPVRSMTEGHIQQAGWHDARGYHVLVVAESGNRYLYAHLDALAADILPGQSVFAGQHLGTMGATGATGATGVTSATGNTGYADASDLRESLVRLHVGISPSVPFAEPFWLNPYPLLRHLESQR